MAVVASGLFNFAGVMLGDWGGLCHCPFAAHRSAARHGFHRALIMVFSLLFSAIVWNLGTWFSTFRRPALIP